VRTAAEPLIDDIDRLPFPAYDLVDMPLYLGATGKRPSLLRMLEQRGIPADRLTNAFIMFSSRGCPFGCTFCYRNFGRQVRRHSVDYVLRHIRFVQDRYGVNNVAFYDETFNSSPQWVREFCRRSRETVPDTFFWMGGARADLLDDDLLVALKQARFYEVSVGVESFDDRILAEMGKRLDAQTLRSAIERLIAHDIAPSYLGMLYGFPGDDEQSLRRSVDEICRLGIPAYFQFPLPFPGTTLFEQLRQEGRIDDVEQYMLRMADQMTQELFYNLSRYPDDVLVRLVREAEREIADCIQKRQPPPAPEPAARGAKPGWFSRVRSRARAPLAAGVRVLKRLRRTA
jgi:anaerobic magnesium-protoporphyrin IX monomethyl ester cyclase